jgi:hypothetical protein
MRSNKPTRKNRCTQGGSALTSSKYLHLMIGTGLGLLTAYLNWRELKRWPYALPNE